MAVQSTYHDRTWGTGSKLPDACSSPPPSAPQCWFESGPRGEFKGQRGCEGSLNQGLLHLLVVVSLQLEERLKDGLVLVSILVPMEDWVSFLINARTF